VTFRDSILADIDDVFFNADEYMEQHTIDGKKYDVIPDALTLQEHNAHWEGGSKQNYDTGIYESVKRIAVRITDYGKAPKVGKLLVYDNIDYAIVGCTDEMGLYIISLKRMRQ
jgi:hypothetical protein